MNHPTIAEDLAERHTFAWKMHRINRNLFILRGTFLKVLFSPAGIFMLAVLFALLMMPDDLFIGR